MFPRLQIGGTVWSALPEEPVSFVVPDDGFRYALLRHDWQWKETDYKPRTYGTREDSPNISLPETVHFVPYNSADFISLTPDRQAFHLGLLRKANPRVSDLVLIQQWKALTMQSVAFTDNHAWNTGTLRGDPSKNFALYAAGLNLQNPPISWKSGISCGGNLVRIIQGNVIEAIDYMKPLPAIDQVWNKPWLIHWATECNGRQSDRLNSSQIIDGQPRAAWRVTPFPQLTDPEGKKTGAPYPIWGAGGVTRVEASRLLPVQAGTKFSPYVP